MSVPAAIVGAPKPLVPALQEVTRSLLEVLGRVTGMESTYLTFID